MSFITTIKQRILNRAHAEERFDPVRNWLILLTVAFITFICIVGGNILTFNRIAEGQMFGAPISTKTVPADDLSIEDVETIFSARANEVKKYQTGEYSFTDPSL
jgi:hypothetical protein